MLNTIAPVAVDVFTAGELGYSCFRIPALLRTPSGGYVAFAEGRNKSCSDYAPTDIVTKTSVDGRTWSNMTVLCPLGPDKRRLCSQHDADYGSSAHSPTPAIMGGRVTLVFQDTHDTPHTRIYAMSALDAAATQWNQTAAVDLTEASGWYGRGIIPGAGAHAISMSAGRLVLPAHSDHWGSTGGTPAGAGVLISDDDGASWRTGNGSALGGNENSVALAPNGSLVQLLRLGSGWKGLSWSDDGGDTWSAPLVNVTSLMRVPGRELLVATTPFNPSYSCGGSFRGRCNMTAWASDDSGASWTLLAKVGTELEDAAYSSLAPYNASHVAMVYERGYGASHVTWTLVPLEGDASRRGR